MRRSVCAIFLAFAVAGPSPVAADPNAGAYLAARQAAMTSDFTQSARYFAEGLVDDPGNVVLMESAIGAFIALGQFDRAVPVAQALVDQGAGNSVAHLVLSVADIKAGDWAALLTATQSGRSIGPLVDTLSQAWAHLGMAPPRSQSDLFE